MARTKSKRPKRIGPSADIGIAHENTVKTTNNIDVKHARDPSPSDSIQSQDLGPMDRSTLDCESQEMLATQFPVQLSPRSSSAGSLQSQGASTRESSVSPSEPHEELSTQTLPREPNDSTSNMSVYKSANFDVSNKARALLQHLQTGKKETPQEKTSLPQDPVITTSVKRGFAIDSLLNPEEGPNIPRDIANNGIAVPMPSTPTTLSHPQSGLAQDSPLQPHLIPPSSHRKKTPVTPEERPRTADHDVPRVPPVVSDPSISTTASIEPSTTQPMEPAHTRDRSVSEDPWAGMRKIRRRDVRIPKDQEALFDNGDPWIPADVGHPTPQGHVPPALLQEWNTRVIRAKETVESPKSPQATPEQEVAESPLPSQFVPQSDDESESDPESNASWSQSPPDHLRRTAVPPDSSPVGRPRFSVTAGFDDRNQEKNTQLDAVNVNINGSNDDLERVSQTPQKLHKVNGAQEEDTTNEDGEAKNQDSSMGSSSVQNYEQKRDEQQKTEHDEMSEDSDMEISIPRALDANLQEDIASQVESHEIGDSAFSNSSSAPIDKIQIQNTQSAGIDPSTKCDLVQPSTAPQSSSDGNKSSSQVIANSVDSKGKRFIVHENDPGTTNGSLVVDSQNINSDEPHSSIPSHQDSQRISEIVPSSSLFSIEFQTQDYMELDDARNETTQSGSMGSAFVTPAITLKRNAEHFESDEESPLKRVFKRVVTNRNIMRTQQSPISPAIKQKILDDKHRHTFDVTPDGAPRVFEMFKKAYSAYTGDFLHFKNLCCKLHLLRRVGLLQNYFFWDDFIMRHIENYGPYVQNCVSAGRHWDDYEDYFCSNFITKPSFKKRSLVPHTLDAVVSESDVPPADALMVDMETQVDMDRVTNGQVACNKPRMMDIGVQASLENQQATASNSGTMSGYGSSIQSSEARQLEITKGQRATINGNSDPISEITCAMNPESREKASLELGGDSSTGNDTLHSREATVKLITRILKEDRRATQTLIRNKQHPQSSLDGLRDDADTPFKTWARADQNVVSERRRRGGWQVPCDKSGIIESEEYSRAGCESGRPTRGWAWQPSADYS